MVFTFQYQETAGEREEEDVSGTCQVQYEVISDQEFRKIKVGCTSSPRHLSKETVHETRVVGPVAPPNRT